MDAVTGRSVSCKTRLTLTNINFTAMRPFSKVGTRSLGREGHCPAATMLSVTILFTVQMHKLLNCCVTSRKVPGSIPGGVTGIFK